MGRNCSNTHPSGGSALHTPFQNAMSEREEDAFPHFSIQARRPTNRTEGKIYR